MAKKKIIVEYSDCQIVVALLMYEFSESDIEEIVARHPEIIEKGLMLKGRQATFRGKRVDLIFADRFGDTLLVELKKGVAKREHVAQLADYTGLIAEQEQGRIRIMLIASVIPPFLQSGLDRFGLEYREITDRDYIEFLKGKDPKLLEEFQKKQILPVTPPKRPKEQARVTTLGQKLGIIWSHNERTFPTWLTTIVPEAIKLQGYVWWSVGWTIKTDQLAFPVTGYICRTAVGNIPYSALMESIETLNQPEKELAKEVYENRQKYYNQGIPRPPYHEDLSPLNKYLNGEKKTLTLLKLVELRKLLPPKQLKDFTFLKGTVPTTCPQKFYYILLS